MFPTRSNRSTIHGDAIVTSEASAQKRSKPVRSAHRSSDRGSLVAANVYSHRVIAVGASICNALTFPLATAAELALYYDLRLCLQGSDVSLREGARA